MTDGLLCECRMPLTWREDTSAPESARAMGREAALLLGAVNMLEGGHEPAEPGTENRRLDRLEAKLDLLLHLLARNLEPGSGPVSRDVRLGAEDVAWRDDAPPPEGTALMLELRPSDALPLTLRLPARALAPEAGWARARFAELPEELAEALTQFLFRRHRQAIRARAG